MTRVDFEQVISEHVKHYNTQEYPTAPLENYVIAHTIAQN